MSVHNEDAKECKQDGLVCDVAESPTHLSGPGQMVVFRLMHVSPKQQKLMRSPVSSLRGDHVAISVASIESRDRAARRMTVAGQRHGVVSNIRVMSLASFLELGMQRVKDGFLRVTVAPSVVYNLHGLSLQETCHSMTGRRAITRLMEANAVPAGDLYYVSDGDYLDVLSVFGVLEEAGLVQSFDNGKCLQFTDRAMACLRYYLDCVNFERFFSARAWSLLKIERIGTAKKTEISICSI